MKKVIFTLLCILFTFSNLFSQSDTTNINLKDSDVDKIIKDIRKQFIKTNDAINGWSEGPLGYAGKGKDFHEYYETGFNIERLNYSNNRLNHPGVGTKYSTFTFYTINRDQTLKLVHSYGIAAFGGLKEYYFDDENGLLIFYFEKNFTGGEQYEERIYFNKSQLIHYQMKLMFRKDDLTLDYRLKDLNEAHYARAKNVLIESNWSINWFDNSQPGLEILKKDTTYQKKIEIYFNE